VQFPNRPLIRISSTFFWHLSSDYDLVSITALAQRSQAFKADGEEETVYPSVKVGEQVSK